MKYCGIDPGQKGAIALLNEDGTLYRYFHYEDVVWKKMLALLSDRKETFRIVLEKLWGIPIRGSQGNWSLGGNYNKWQLIMELAEVSNIEIPPQTWQKLILNTAKKKSGETKPLSLAYVNKRYPELNLPYKRSVDINTYSGVSDAICMALYSRYLHLNRL